VEQSGGLIVFYGQYEHSIDQKGRIIIPSKIRQILEERFSEKFIATRGLDKCISLFTQDGWNEMVDKVKTLPFMTGKESRAFTRLLFSGAVECSLDKQGRILLPPELREYAGIKNSAEIVGVSSHIEIWGKERWEDYISQESEKFEKTAEGLVEFGI
jgi:MraZ protein